MGLLLQLVLPQPASNEKVIFLSRDGLRLASLDILQAGPGPALISL